MSAIFGIGFHQGSKEEKGELSAKLAVSLAFRGDIGSTILSGDNCLLGVLRFGHDHSKPLFDEEKYAVVFEGEIYNREELGRELGLGRNAGEGEIVLALYKQEGPDFPRRLNGIFGVAVHDGAEHRIVLARDHVGSRSLYYSRSKQGLVFSTTIRSLLDTGVVDRELSLHGINSYFSSTAVSPPDTLYAQVRAVPPGTTVSLAENGDVVERVYWQVSGIREDRGRTMEDYADEVRELIVDAVRIRAGAGGRCGSIVSGGVDSSVVTALLTRQLASGDLLPVFSVVFAEKPYSDAALQKFMYDGFPLHPYQATMSSEEYWNILNKALENLDTPVNDDALAGMYRVFELARAVGCTAVFEGEAADELFFTGHVHSERRLQKFLSVPFFMRRSLLGSLFVHNSIGGGLGNKIKRLLFKIGIDDTERRLMVLTSFYRTARPIMGDENFAPDRDPLETARRYLTETVLHDPLNIYYYGLLKTFLPDDLLYKNERMASANGITNRTPFIDYRLVELALKVPEKYKVRKPTEQDDGTKIVYKKAIEGIIPGEILYRKKTRGFSIPSAEWYKSDLRDKVHDLMLGSKREYGNYLDEKYVKELYDSYMGGAKGIDSLFQSVMLFELWLRKQKRTAA